jgi:dihydrofolate reductase
VTKMAQITVIGAFAKSTGIYGTSGEIPWRCREDMAWFKRHTTGATVIMGRKTWESLPEKFRPLPGRQNIVVTSDSEYDLPEGVLCASSVEEALGLADRDSIFLIGGKSIWLKGLEVANRLLISEIGWKPTDTSKEFLRMGEFLDKGILRDNGFSESTVTHRLSADLGEGQTGSVTFATYERQT